MVRWIKLAAALLCIALLLWIGYSLYRGAFALLSGTDLNSGEPDPMFAPEAEIATRPPELDAEEAPVKRPTLDDYVPEVESPVDKTADELIREAQAGE